MTTKELENILIARQIKTAAIPGVTAPNNFGAGMN